MLQLLNSLGVNIALFRQKRSGKRALSNFPTRKYKSVMWFFVKCFSNRGEITMFSRLVVRSAFIALALGLGSAASAGVIWNETVNGDLSNDGLSPTFVGTLTLGSN